MHRHAVRRLATPAKRHRGITILEVLIALTILGLLLGIALPAVSGAVSRVRSVGARAAISTTLFDAQRDATVLGQEVVICPGQGAGCQGGSDWSRGWLAFVDSNGDRQFGPDEPLVHREPALPSGVRLIGTAGRTRLVYQPNGSNAGSNISFTLCDRRGPTSAQSLVLANGGRLRHDRAPPADAATCMAGL